MGLSGVPSLQAEENLYFGEWPLLEAIVDPTGAASIINLGRVVGGTFRTSRETIQIQSTTFPQYLEVSVPSVVNMGFTGTAQELAYGLAHFLVGDARIDDPSHYVYPAAGCAFGDIDVGLRGERVNCADELISFYIWRARASGAIEIGAEANGLVGTPIELNALSDVAGRFGGSASAPLGYLWFSRA